MQRIKENKIVRHYTAKNMIFFLRIFVLFSSMNIYKFWSKMHLVDKYNDLTLVCQ